jgi:hypothetical protein
LNTYTKAVKFIEEYLKATNTVFEDQDLPNIETGLEFAIGILKKHDDYQAA